MKKKLIAGLILSIFALTTAIPMGLCAQPPPSEWPPEPEWHPMSPDEAQPEIPTMIWPYGGEYYLEPGQPFYIRFGWLFLPTNEAYDLSGEPVTPSWDLQDRTDSAYCRIAVTMNGEPLEPTGSFRATCKWGVVWDYDREPPEDIIVPRSVVYYYYFEFPDGLPEGVYYIVLYGQPSGGEPFEYTTILYVE
ncbi:hypothetical protein KAU30_00645 [Candidatus Bathyarchaeota archaeon]|nr:hypothetical protein [Candidatus Bathyarchaeota archaeon]